MKVKMMCKLGPATISRVKAAIKPEYDAKLYVDGLEAEVNRSDNQEHYEIPAMHSRTGNPVVIDLPDSDFIWDEAE